MGGLEGNGLEAWQSGLGWGLGVTMAAAVPLLMVACTAFLKISVVLVLFRRALGTTDVPPSFVLMALAILLAARTMLPVLEATQERVRGWPEQASSEWTPEAVADALIPLQAFVRKHADSSELALFREIGQRQASDSGLIAELLVTVPAFVVSELKEAFWIGFVLFLPFLVIELVVAQVLLASGLMGLSAVAVALPFKLLLFVAVDGWSLLARGLILGYQ